MIDAIKTAIFNSMAANSQISAMLGNPLRLHDAPVRNSVFPFAIWRRFEQKPIAYDYSDAFEIYVSIEITSKTNGNEEARKITDAINNWAINARPVSDELEIPFLMMAYSDVMRATDGRSFIGLIKLKLIAQLKGE